MKHGKDCFFVSCAVFCLLANVLIVIKVAPCQSLRAAWYRFKCKPQADNITFFCCDNRNWCLFVFSFLSFHQKKPLTQTKLWLEVRTSSLFYLTISMFDHTIKWTTAWVWTWGSKSSWLGIGFVWPLATRGACLNIPRLKDLMTMLTAVIRDV